MLGEVALEANQLDGAELRLEPIDVLLFAPEHLLKHPARGEAAARGATRQCPPDSRAGAGLGGGLVTGSSSGWERERAQGGGASAVGKVSDCQRGMKSGGKVKTCCSSLSAITTIQ